MFTMLRNQAVVRSGFLCAAFAVSILSSRAADEPNAAIERGRYLVERVAMCQDCHTPRLMDSNQFIKSQWLKGAPLTFTPVNAPPNWRSKAPDITSTSPLWSRWGEDGMVKFLETGRNPRGNPADPPMPAYALSHEDALAVAAYLKSLK